MGGQKTPDSFYKIGDMLGYHSPYSLIFNLIVLVGKNVALSYNPFPENFCLSKLIGQPRRCFAYDFNGTFNREF